MASGYVYFVRARESRRIKIGFTAQNPHGRARDMQTGAPELLDVVAAFPGEMHDERRMHERFKKQRIHGEWFLPGGELEAFIDGLLAANPEIGADRFPPGGTLGVTSVELDEIATEIVSRREYASALARMVEDERDGTLVGTEYGIEDDVCDALFIRREEEDAAATAALLAPEETH